VSTVSLGNQAYPWQLQIPELYFQDPDEIEAFQTFKLTGDERLPFMSVVAMKTVNWEDNTILLHGAKTAPFRNEEGKKLDFSMGLAKNPTGGSRSVRYGYFIFEAEPGPWNLSAGGRVMLTDCVLSTLSKRLYLTMGSTISCADSITICGNRVSGMLLATVEGLEVRPFSEFLSRYAKQVQE